MARTSEANHLALYFAFGSNMSRARLHKRIADAAPVGLGLLRGHRFACNKVGNDGSGKANVAIASDDKVWGVVYRMPRPALDVLDSYEGGYVRCIVGVETEAGVLHCATYRSDGVRDGLKPRAWYKRHILQGARENGLPAHWIEMLRALPTRT